MSQYDVIIIGAGSMGMSAGYQLAKLNQKVLMIDAHNPPHLYGSHGGHTRLIRHALEECYLPLSLRSQEMWNSIHETAEEIIFRKTGVVTFGYPESEVVQIAMEALKTNQLEGEIFISGDEINQRFKGLNLPSDYIGVFEPNAGVIDAIAAIRFLKNQALALGAELLVHTKVDAIDVIDSSCVRVMAGGQEFEARKVIVTAGAHTQKLLLPLGKKIKNQVSRRTVAWFESDEDLYSDEVFPGFIGKVADGYHCYGFPSINNSGVKIGAHNFGQDLDVEEVNFDFGAYEEDESVVRYFLDRYMPEANGRLIKGAACMYQMTPDEHFIIDFHPDYPNVLIAAGFSGHGFKFVPVVGEILAQLVDKGQTEHNINQFSLQRPGILEDIEEDTPQAFV